MAITGADIEKGGVRRQRGEGGGGGEVGDDSRLGVGLAEPDLTLVVWVRGEILGFGLVQLFPTRCDEALAPDVRARGC